MWDYDQVMMLHNVIFANYLGDLCPQESLTVKKLHAQFNGTSPQDGLVDKSVVGFFLML